MQLRKDIESQPSVFKVRFIEIVIGIVVGVALVFMFRYILWRLEPWGWQFQQAEFYPDWFIQLRETLFLGFGWFMFILGFLPRFV